MRICTIIIAGFIALSACNTTGGHDTGKDAPVNVTIQQPVFITYSDSLRATGILNTQSAVKLSFKTGGIVESVAVREGQTVKKGELLASLNLSEISARARQASIALEKQERDHKRAVNLFLDSVITLETLQNAKSAYEMAKTEKNIADFNLGHSKIVAPSTGNIQRILVEKGEIIAPGYPALLFASTENNWVVKVSLADRDIVRFREGDRAVAELDAFPGKRFSARVTELAALADPVTGTFSAELMINETDPAFRSGFIARTFLFPSDSLSGWYLPFEAVHDLDHAKGFVYLLDGKTVHKQEVHIAGLVGKGVILNEGVSGEHLVVTEGGEFLKEGTIVRVMNSENESEQ
jgi:membrane fusion protein, multidrug efflux system